MPATTPIVLPAPSLEQALRVERTAANAPTNEIPLSGAAPLAAQTAATALERERQVGKPQPQTDRETASPQPAGTTATRPAQPQRDEDTRSKTHRTTSLTLSTSPREWLAGYAACDGKQAPVTIRITAAMPNAAAVRSWVMQLRDQLTQRGWPTHIELAQDSSLSSDQLWLETLSALP
ncbi:hypothetical protein [Xanthomonas bromi]|uniref:hypothetical protein n=1 Tax=Xanthomonas bromi TaxID=56449 RepID=UPI001111AA49|nr:hypothetical protein [Xanthomonas bromi]